MSESVSGNARKAAPTGSKERGLFARIGLFLRQIVAELKKVVRPSRSELWTMFVVVIVFVLAMMLFTGVLDTIFGQLVLWIFG